MFYNHGHWKHMLEKHDFSLDHADNKLEDRSERKSELER